MTDDRKKARLKIIIAVEFVVILFLIPIVIMTARQLYRINKSYKLLEPIPEDYNYNIYMQDPIKTQGNISYGEFKSTILAYKLLPEALRKKFMDDGWKIIIFGRKIPDTSADGELGDDYMISGLTCYDIKTIYIIDSSSLWHEIGHYLDRAYPGETVSDNISDIYENELAPLNAIYARHYGYGLSSHNTSSGPEFFASAFHVYMYWPDELSDDCPQVYAMIERQLEKLEKEYDD